MPKESFDNRRELLKFSQCTHSKPFQVVGSLDHASSNVVSLRIVPCLLYWIELRRIPWQKEQSELSIGAFSIFSNIFASVNRMAIKDKKNRTVAVFQKP